MGRKIGLYLSLFLIVLFVNIYLSTALSHRVRSAESSAQILAEIEADTNSDSEHDFANTPVIQSDFESQVVTGDARSKNLRHFFRKYNSELYDYADYIIKVSDKYGFDYRLLPAIAMQESNLCKYIPEKSYNCWGWGIYGDTSLGFSSYEEAIDTVAEGIKTNYIDHGLVTASSIMKKYTPSSNGSWARGVNNVLGWLE
jgi:hypothetical protein